MVQIKMQQINPEIFAVWNDEIEGRLDPVFYIFQNKTCKNQVAIKEVATIQGGYAFKSSEYLDNGVPLVRIQNLRDGEIILDEKVFIASDRKYEFERFLLNEGDILIAMTGATIGKIGRVGKEDLPSFLNQRVGRFVVKKEKVNPEFLYFILQLSVFKSQILRYSLGGAQPNISPQAIENLGIPLPSKETQEKVVSIMQKAHNEKRRKEKQAKELLDSIDGYVLGELGIEMPEIERQMVFEVWSDELKDRLDVEYYKPGYEEIIGAIKKSGHSLAPLGEITEFIMNGRTPSRDSYSLDESGTPIIKAGTAAGKLVNLEKIGHVKEDFKGKKKARKGDIFILSAAHQAQYVGKNVSLLDEEPKQATYFVGELIGVRANLDKCSSDYLFSFLSSKIIYLLMNREKRGQTSHLYPEDLQTIKVPVPKVNLQERISMEVRLCRERAKKLHKEAGDILEKAKREVEEIILG